MSYSKKDCPLHILPAHFEEWVEDSGVSARITALNVRSLSDPDEIDELLNRNTKNRWQHWQHGPGWAVTGVDPQTGNTTYDGAQFKPDKPVHRRIDGVPKFKRDGSPDYQKYFSASRCESEPLFLDTGEPDYWLSVMGTATRRVLITEGAKKAGAALTAGEACISLPGVSNGQRKGRLKKSLERFCQPGRTIVLGFDSDLFHNPNVCKALHKLGLLLRSRDVLVQILMLPRDTKGLDDFIVTYGQEAFKQLVEGALTFEEWRDEYILHPTKEVKTTAPDIPDAEENYQLKAQAALFSDRPWVSIHGKLHRWTGTHYELQEEDEIKAVISRWCSVTPVFTSEGWKRSYATATHIDNIYAWVQRSFAVATARVNPPGLNCLNGVLKISWEGRKPKWELVKHDPSVIYTYVGEFEFNPNADATACDRLLSCLDEPQQEIFIKTLAASLDLVTIKKFRSRVRALLCKGDGNNGKDSLREAVALLYGVGVVNTTMNDFAAYDQGRKFPLAKLEQARVSWSSENSSFSQLDNLQSLKQAITGEPLDFELKNQTERPMHVNTVFFFNINNVPNLQASMEAIQSRWAVLTFNKTFKVNADPSRCEIEADPRFRYDPNFLRREVVPALLNKMLAALPEVAMNAIDYSCTDGALEEIREEKNHLLRFAREVGLGFRPGEKVYVKDLWELLTKWYVEHGYAAIETNAKGQQKPNFLDSGSPGDRPVKKIGDVPSRFLELFPKAKRGKENGRHPTHANDVYLLNLGIGEGNSTSNGTSRSYAVTPAEYLESVGLDSFIASLPAQLLENLRVKIENQPSHPSTPSNDKDCTLPPSFPSSLHHPSTSPNSPESISFTDFLAPNGVITGNVASGGVTVNNSAKNFDSDRPDFRPGDRVKAKSPGIYGIPANRVLTIVKIEGDMATVTFKGCRSIDGCPVSLSELRHV